MAVRPSAPDRLPCPCLSRMSLRSESREANPDTGSVERTAAAIAAILVREGVDYARSRAIFQAARQQAGLRAPPGRRRRIDRPTLTEELRLIDQAYAQGGRTGLMLQTLPETGVRVSELVQLRVEDISLAERVVIIRRGKGARRREVPIRREPARLLALHIGTRRTGPLFASRQQGSGPRPCVYTRQRTGQIVRDVAAVPWYGDQRRSRLPWTREHHNNPALCAGDSRHAAAPVRPAHGACRSGAGDRYSTPSR